MDIKNLFLNNHGNGIGVFEKVDCLPPYFYFGSGERFPVDKSVKPYRPIKIRSFSTMRTTDCVRLNASVTKFTFGSDKPSKLDMENVTSSLESVFRDNGTAKISQVYSVAQRYKETVEFTKATGWATVPTVGTDATVEVKTKAEIPFFASSEVTMKIGKNYRWQNTQSGSDTERKNFENEETTTISQTIEIPPCTEYHVNSYVQMAKNHSVEYIATARVIGKVGDDFLYGYELKDKQLGPEIEFVRQLDEFSIEVQVKGQMFVKCGIKTFIVGEGHPMEGCLQNFPNNSRPNVPKHFEIELPLKKGKE